ncbi:MAG: heme/hemin ABC transporter substrate-binding protein [Gemmatimonadaceae bacterium]
MIAHPRRAVRLALALAIGLAACRGAGAPTQATRIVCVSKQINEFMYDIGAESLIVARDLTSIYPPQITSLPSVGYHRALSAEGIISMKPTLFLTDGNVGPQPVLDQLKKVGIPILVITPGNTLDSAQSLMSQLGQRFNHAARADSIIAAWSSGMDSVFADTAQWSGGKRPRVLMIHFGQIANNYLALKRGGVADLMLHWAGAENAIDSVGGMSRLTPELIAKAAPDIIIATDVGFDRYGSAEKFATMPGVSLTPAGKSLRIYRLPEDYIMYFGPRTPEGVRKLAAWFHPGATTATTAGGR